MKILKIIGKKTMICIFCMTILIGLSSCTNGKDRNNFQHLSIDIKQIQTDISNKIEESESLLSNTSEKDVADSSLIVDLRNEINSAKQTLFEIPDMASETEALNLQIKTLTTKKRELQKRLAAFEKSVIAIEDSKQKLIDKIDEEKRQAILPIYTHSIIATDNNGNKEKITIKIGKWIKGSEMELLNEAWQIVGGNGTMPLTGSYEGDGLTTGGIFKSNEAAFVFGTVSIQNLTPNFTANNFSNGVSSVYLVPKIQFDGFVGFNWASLNEQGFGNVAQARQYSSGVISNRASGYNPLINADMQSNLWGPCPFVIGVEDVFTPNYPEGNPKIDEIKFFLSSSAFATIEGDNKFQIGKSW